LAAGILVTEAPDILTPAKAQESRQIRIFVLRYNFCSEFVLTYTTSLPGTKEHSRCPVIFPEKREQISHQACPSV
jgi:hypothetical protein